MTKVALAVLIQFPFHLNGISGLDLDPDPSQEVTDPNNILDIFGKSIQHLENPTPPQALKRTPTGNQVPL